MAAVCQAIVRWPPVRLQGAQGRSSLTVGQVPTQRAPWGPSTVGPSRRSCPGGGRGSAPLWAQSACRIVSLHCGSLEPVSQPAH